MFASIQTEVLIPHTEAKLASRYRAHPGTYSLPPHIKRVFETACAFRTLADHARAAVHTLGIVEADAPQITQLFHEFRERGMLISEAEFLDSLQKISGEDSADSIASISVITASESQAANTLQSIRTYLDRTGRQTAVRTLAAEDRSLVDSLIDTGLDPAVVSFALLDDEQIGWAGGANRNRWLLLTQGELAFSCDDDIVWRPYLDSLVWSTTTS